MKSILIILALVLSLLPLGAVYHKIGFFDSPESELCVTIVGSLAYVTENTVLKIIDISNPQDPNLLSNIDIQGNARSVTVSSGLAYVAAGAYGLKIIDVSNSLNPFLIGSFSTPCFAQGVAFADNIAYIVGRQYNGPHSDGLSILDVSDPENPTQLGFYHTPEDAYSVSVIGSIAYVTYLSYTIAGLQIIDVSNPGNPILIGTYSCFAFSVNVQGNLAYIASSGSGLQIIDISTPQNPVLLGSYNTPGCAFYVTVVDGIAYVADGNSGLQVINVSNPQNPFLISTYDTVDVACSVTIADGVAFVAGGMHGLVYYDCPGLHIIDVSNPYNPTLLGSFDTPGSASSVTVEDDIAYVTDDASGMKIIDVNNPQNPILLGSYGNGAHFVTVEGNTAYVIDGELKIVDVSNPENPNLLGSYYVSNASINFVAIVGNIAYITVLEWVMPRFSGLMILDISNPENPTLLGSFQGSVQYAAVVDSMAYLVASWYQEPDNYSGLQIIDVSNPQNPILLGSYATPGSPQSVITSGGIAYVADGSSGLQVINVVNPASLTLVSTILPHATSNINLCYMHDNLLYISDANWNEISVYDITIPLSPVFVSSYAWNLNTVDMCVSSGRMFTANEEGGLNILNLIAVDNDDEVQYPSTAFQMRNYPNPFNPETTITYTLPAKGQVCLEIYNSRGQLVKSLLNEPQAKGEHSLTWNGKDDNNQSVASGLYLCRITSAGKHESRKLLLLK